MLGRTAGQSDRAHPLRAWLGLAFVVALVATSCGTRISHENIVSAWNRDGGSGGRTGAGGSAEGEPGAEGSITGPEGEATAGGAGVSGTEGAAGGVAGAAGPAAAAGGGPAATATKPAILLGNVGSYSGLASTQSGNRDALQVWVKWVNDHGGVNGHPVKLIIADDGGDSNRAAAQVKDMVENQHVLAFLGNYADLTLGGYHQYLKDKHIPVIGGDVNEVEWNQSPVLFPQGAAIDAQLLAIPIVGARAGKKRLGLLYCSEAESCGHAATLLWEGGGARRGGMEPAYRASVSLVQPSFTSECLQAQRAGVDAFYLVSDAFSLARLATDCHRQGFNPLYLAGSTTLTDDLANDPNLDGLRGVQGTFPWFQSDTPATREFHAAIRKYAPGLDLSYVTAQGWTAGKLFERVGAVFGDGPVTTAQIFEGLWAIKNDTLGGLAPALTFVRNKPAPSANCVFFVQIEGRKWVQPPGHPMICPQLT